MNAEEIKSSITAVFAGSSADEAGEWPVVAMDAEDWLNRALLLRDTREWLFDYLFCVTGIDWKTHFTVVFHLRSLKHRHSVVIKIQVDRDKPQLDSVSSVWRTAEFHEREVYDLFGIRFSHHPDLRRLFLTEDWNGWPLRKDYEDPVNMIKL
ncbi:MAG: NADH-quinone oxidoreductase subunit C [Bacteroidia bacterium]|nr:NADH-quinone oxidoreductase subunit C [Bacteroidia bacterium]